MSVVDPSGYIPQLVVYATFNIFAACGLVALLTVTLIVQGFTANPSLVNLEIIFIISSSTSSALIWTGHARDTHPPFGLCLFNAAATMSNTPLMAGAALALVLKVWGIGMGIWHPRLTPLTEWATWTPFLLLFPFISAIPLFLAGIVMGLEHRDQVFRGSPFYCVVNLDTPQTTSSILGAAFTLTSLVLAAWTSVNLIKTRQRAGRGRFTEDPGSVSPVFATRVLLFSFFVGAAFVSGIVALTSEFDAVIPDIVVASCGVGAFFIFASAKPILQFVFCRGDHRKNHVPSSLTWGSEPITPQEFTLASMTIIHTGKQPSTPGTGSFGQGIQITRVKETLDEEGKPYRWSSL
ncbi:hypothetical protein MSAN_02339200 [Mycena sanguinolenta]|uniref:Uncharacterized protein n=1 Tax=Mycena sanguinolenta TaxID=230812 RepID=A0A8H6X742_9AGAR|nr:hypothetical protein MSAN_02339200 [Mycena sanguinolenta]